MRVQFQDMLRWDLERVILCPKELAQAHTIEGKPVWLVEDQDAQSVRRSGGKAEEMWMFEHADRVIYLGEGERVRAGLPAFAANQRLLYDQEYVVVTRAALADGLWTLALASTTGGS